MKKWTISILLTVTLLMTTRTLAFTPYDDINKTGTYAETSTLIYIQFDSNKESLEVINNLVLTDSTDTVIAWESILPLNDIGGRASRFQGTLAEELDKTEDYTLVFGALSIALAIDNSAPLISYTNKVRNDASLYDDVNNTFLVEYIPQNWWQQLFSDQEAFDIEPYLRLNVIDNRDGSLLDQLEMEGLPDPYTKGRYETTLSATDSWGNTATETFTFEVVDTGTNTVWLQNLGMALGLLAILSVPSFLIWKGRAK
jgi:hypothetical protein